MSLLNQDDLMRRCWNDPDARSCVSCRAYHKRDGGKCCFGLRFETGDPPCEECPHSDDCKRLTQIHIAKTGGSAVRRKINVRTPTPEETEPEESYPKTTLVPDSELTPLKRSPKRVTIQHWIHRGGWGAAEGALELLLGSFRYRRPPP